MATIQRFLKRSAAYAAAAFQLIPAAMGTPQQKCGQAWPDLSKFKFAQNSANPWCDPGGTTIRFVGTIQGASCRIEVVAPFASRNDVTAVVEMDAGSKNPRYFLMQSKKELRAIRNTALKGVAVGHDAYAWETARYYLDAALCKAPDDLPHLPSFDKCELLAVEPQSAADALANRVKIKVGAGGQVVSLEVSLGRNGLPARASGRTLNTTEAQGISNMLGHLLKRFVVHYGTQPDEFRRILIAQQAYEVLYQYGYDLPVAVNSDAFFSEFALDRLKLRTPLRPVAPRTLKAAAATVLGVSSLGKTLRLSVKVSGKTTWILIDEMGASIEGRPLSPLQRRELASRIDHVLSTGCFSAGDFLRLETASELLIPSVPEKYPSFFDPRSDSI